MDWYCRISHVTIQNPAHRSTYDPRSKASISHNDSQLNAKALTIARPIMQLDYIEVISGPKSLYNAFKPVTQLLEGQHIDEEQHSPLEHHSPLEQQ
ncbi:unnamed protein product [Camellia sinensis]